MNKVTKIVLIIAGALAGLGLVFCIAALILGVNFNSIQYNGRTFSDLTTVEHSFQEAAALNIDLEIGGMTVKETDGKNFTVTAADVKEDFVCEEKNGVLYIANKDHRKFRLWNLRWGNRQPNIILEVPRGTVFQETKMDIGVGQIELYDFNTRDLKIDCGVGSVNLDGSIQGNSSLNCGVGRIKMKLVGNQSDFNYNIDCGVGEVKIGSNSYSGLGHSKTESNQSDYNMEIDCGVGGVEISFEE